MQNISNKVALITGGSKGIGYGIAEALVNKGVKVAITSRSQSSADEAAKSLGGPDKVLALEADVRSFESQQSCVTKIIEKWGQLDYVIANAGLGHFASVADLSADQWNEVIDTNLTGPFYTIKSSLEALKKSKGYFITISSLAGTNFFPGGSAYNASKFGLTGFTQAVMLDLRHEGINVSTIMPGSVATHFNNHEPNEADAWKIQPEDLGKMVVDLFEMDSRTLPSKIEVRPSQPPKK
ncbi:SDR family oxidoreductase [Marivirga atlantica]|jgi:NAD(P)-dependent dehydrogenase (short-subunit alcohol dehydrogenase family)|uniref:SDR family oxidoreductase n=1 Tax=Marivirga atlantica TaxID=1548457 RepID=A0A937A8Z3_9BACT|nr:SDR family oxidoreductase [Marivirga atlantica]MBL0765805.1 SDR family oxidoreductase [Marivirga atlantica]